MREAIGGNFACTTEKTAEDDDDDEDEKDSEMTLSRYSGTALADISQTASS